MKLGVIGCGRMGMALVEGAMRAGVVRAEEVAGCDPNEASREAFRALTGREASRDARGLAADCEVLLLCTKPQDAVAALAAATDGGGEALVISVVAGLKLAALEAAVPAGLRVIRAMPNTPALVGEGAAAFCRGSRAGEADAALARDLLGAVGLALELPEKHLDAVTGLSGSGPAYVYLVIEALADGGVRAGLPREQAQQLAAQTVLGAAAMVLRTGEHPGVLKDRVTSPGGTTIEGLAVLENRGLRGALIEAVSAAARRAGEL